MIALIPARGGSQALPRKNMLPLHGKPLIAYTIEAAQRAKSVERVIVSTDSQEIAEVARQYGAEVPFLRPAELATNQALAIDVYIYTIERLNREQGSHINAFCVLLPTSPLRDSDDIDAAIDTFSRNNADAVVAVCEAPFPINWLKRINAAGMLEYVFPVGRKDINRQEEEKHYIPNGSIYVLKLDQLKSHQSYYAGNVFPYVMDRQRSIDIDTSLDFELAALLVHKRLLSFKK